MQNDPKALFRRCQAYDALGRVEEAYQDVMTLMKVDPKNSAVVPLYQKLNPIMQDRVSNQTALDSLIHSLSYSNGLVKKGVKGLGGGGGGGGGGQRHRGTERERGGRERESEGGGQREHACICKIQQYLYILHESVIMKRFLNKIKHSCCILVTYTYMTRVPVQSGVSQA